MKLITILRLFFVIQFIAYANLGYAIVDYTNQTITTNEEVDLNASVKKIDQSQSLSKDARRSIWKSDWSLGTHFEAHEINGEKISSLHLNTHIQTPVNIYLEVSYWNALYDAEKSEGNPKAIVGFNWLRLGSPEEEARLNFFGGGQFAAKSKLGSSRTDKIVGVETTKRFQNFGLGLGYDLTLVGLPENQNEMAIGNIGRLVFSTGWVVSNDIQFEVEVENFMISSAKNSRSASQERLDKKLNFSTISPKLSLGLSSVINLQLGARFRMKKIPASQNLDSMKVFDLHGANGNSLFAGLGLSF